MTVERNAFGYDIQCDRCSHTQDVDSPDHFWEDVMAVLRQEGWRYQKDAAGDWEHVCPSCLDKEERI